MASITPLVADPGRIVFERDGDIYMNFPDGNGTRSSDLDERRVAPIGLQPWSSRRMAPRSSSTRTGTAPRRILRHLVEWTRTGRHRNQPDATTGELRHHDPPTLVAGRQPDRLLVERQSTANRSRHLDHGLGRSPTSRTRSRFRRRLRIASPAGRPTAARSRSRSRPAMATTPTSMSMNADGSGSVPRPADHDASPQTRMPRWSPDGTKIAFTRDATATDNQPEIYVMDADGLSPAVNVDERPGRRVASPQLVPGRQPDHVHLNDRLTGNQELYAIDATATSPSTADHDPRNVERFGMKTGRAGPVSRPPPPTTPTRSPPSRATMRTRRPPPQ